MPLFLFARNPPSPPSFGFNTSKFEENGVETVICGIVSMKINNILVEHTYVCHLFRKTDDGLELRTRFWRGNKLKGHLLRNLFITETTALNTILHCSEAYNHLGGVLPEIYAEFSGSTNDEEHIKPNDTCPGFQAQT